MTLVRIDASAPVARVTLDRPERHNSLVPELLVELRDAVAAVAANPEVRVVVLDANGRSFSTGGDVAGFYDAGNDVATYAAEVVGLLNETLLAMLRLPQPIVTAVHGVVTGGSFGLLLASDVVLISPDASITPWYGVVGFSPDGGWTALFPQLVGRIRATTILAQNLTITAEDAVAWGIASRIAPSAEIRQVARATALDVAGMDSGAVRAAKRLAGGDLGGIAAALEAEREAFVAQIVTSEAQAGMREFLGR